MLITKIVNPISNKTITITLPYTIVCNGIKKTSNAKVNTLQKLEKQFNQLAIIIDKKPKGFLKRIKTK